MLYSILNLEINPCIAVIVVLVSQLVVIANVLPH